MKRIVEYIKENRIIFLLMLLFFLIRLPFLDQLNLLHDERDISLSGYSIAKTGKDLSGNFLPLSIENIAPDNPVVSIYFSAFGWLVLNSKSVFNARLPYVLISTLLIPLIYSLVCLIKKDKKLAILTSIICCFSPWIFHLTRLSMDVTLAFVTLLAAALFQLRGRKYLSFIFYTLSFYNYQGFRILIPFLIVYLITSSDNRKIFVNNLILYITFLVVLFSSILYIDQSITQKRIGQVAFLNPTYFENIIIFNRNTSAGLPFIKSIFDNKITAPINYVASSFVKGLDFTFLFKDGDYSAINGSISGGQFFLPLILFYFMGFLRIGKKLDKKTLFVVGFIPLGMLPAILSLNGLSFGIRGIFSSIGYAFIIANGLILSYELLSKQKNSKLYYGAIIIFISLLFVNITNFVYIYYFRRPILVGELFNENERKISQYIIAHKDRSRQNVYINNPENLKKSYIFLNNSSSKFTPQFFDCKKYKSNKVKDAITIVSTECISDTLYAKLIKDTTQTKIWYSDYSSKVAYFIFE